MALSIPKINKIMVYKINKIVICKSRPIKYLDNKSLIVSSDFENLPSLPFGIIVITPFFNNWLSFIKKKDINNTENRPTLKDPTVAKTAFKKSGISLNWARISIFFNLPKTSIPLEEK